MSRQYRFATVLCLVIFTAPSHAFASTAEDLALKVKDFVQHLVLQAYPDASRIIVTASSPDKRLDLSQCLDPDLTLHGTQKIGRRMLVKVNCANILAIHLSVDIQVMKPAIAVERSLTRGTILSASDVHPVETNILKSGRHYLFSVENAIGQNLKRSVRQGTLLTAGMLAQPELVARGDAVIITAHRGSLMVRMPGTALTSGALGEQVSVKNTKTDRVVRGLVAARGEVSVRF
jgi:flagella basal body P-ring formation protein FlgA